MIQANRTLPKGELRWRMQSLKTGWGVEAENTPAGKKELHKMRRRQKEQFKYCRIYRVRQLLPENTKLMAPFQLTQKKFGQMWFNGVFG